MHLDHLWQRGISTSQINRFELCTLVIFRMIPEGNWNRDTWSYAKRLMTHGSKSYDQAQSTQYIQMIYMSFV